MADKCKYFAVSLNDRTMDKTLMFTLFGGLILLSVGAVTLYFGITSDTIAVSFTGGFFIAIGGIITFGISLSIIPKPNSSKKHRNSTWDQYYSTPNKDDTDKEIFVRRPDLSVKSNPSIDPTNEGLAIGFLVLGVVFLIFGFIGVYQLIAPGIIVLFMSLFMFIIHRKQVRAFENNSFIKEDIYRYRLHDLPHMVKDEIAETYGLEKTNPKDTDSKYNRDEKNGYIKCQYCGESNDDSRTRCWSCKKDIQKETILTNHPQYEVARRRR